MNRNAWLFAVALSASLCTGAFAQVTGTAKLEGKAPARKPVPGLNNNPQCAGLRGGAPALDESIVADAQGNLANVVIFLRGPNVKGAAPNEPVSIDQVGCQYVPHVISATVGQKVLAMSDDAFLHNVHTLPANSPETNIAMPGKDRNGVALKKFVAEEFVKTKCDVHPWMGAWIAVFDHPFHTVTGEDGAFELDVKGLPNGVYEIVAWQEKLKLAAPQKININGGKVEKPVDFVFQQKPAAGAGAPAGAGADAGRQAIKEREVTLTALMETVPVAAEGKACEACEKAKAAALAAKTPAPAAVAK